MGLRSKSRMRLLVLTGACVAAVAVVGGGYAALKVHRTNLIKEGRPKGLEAYKNGEWLAALHHLGPYLQQYEDDVECLDTFAKVREKLPESNGTHISNAKTSYSRLVALRPENLDYRRALARLDSEMGANTETVRDTNEIIDRVARMYIKALGGTPPAVIPGVKTSDNERNDRKALVKTLLDELQTARGAGKDTPELRAQYLEPLSEAFLYKVVANQQLGKLDDARDAMDNLLKLDPDSPETCENDAALRLANQESYDSVLRRAEAWAKARPKDLAGQLKMARIYGQCLQTDKAKAAALEGASLPIVREKDVLPLVDILDRLECFADAEKVLQKGIEQFKSNDLENAHFLRLMYAEQWQQIDEEVAKLDVTRRAVPAALRAIALCERAKALDAGGKKEEALKMKAQAGPLMKALAECGARWDTLALGWHDVLEMIYFPETLKEKPRDAEVIAKCSDAIDRDRRNAFFRQCQGEVYQAGGDSSAALNSWHLAAVLAPTWSKPLTRAARFFASVGNPSEALSLAKSADRRLPNQRETMVAIAVSWSAALGQPEVGTAEELLAYMTDTIQARYPFDESTLSLQVSLITKIKGKPAGEARVREALASIKADQGAVFAPLAVVCHQLELGGSLDMACIDAYRKLIGETPDLAFTECKLLVQDGQKAIASAEAAGNKPGAVKARANMADSVKKLFSERSAEGRKKPDAPAEQWDLAWCGILEALGDNGAHDAWKSVVQTYPASSRSQWAALNARSIQADHSLMGMALDRIAAINGESGLTWQLLKGQWLLDDRNSRDNVDKAVKLLNKTVAASPESIPARKLLALAYEYAGNISGAQSELSRAAQIDPHDLDVKVELASMYARQKEQIRAVEMLKQVAAATYATEAQRARVGQMLAQLGETDLSVQLLEASSTIAGSAGQSMLPRLLWQKGDAKSLERAKLLYEERLADKPTVEMIEQAMQFFIQTRDEAGAQKALAELAKSDAPEALKHAIKGAYYDGTGKPDESIAEFREAAKLDPTKPIFWRKLVASELAGLKIDDAIKSAADAKAAVPDEAAFKAILDLGADAKAALADYDVRYYFVTAVSTPADSRGIGEVIPLLHAFEKTDVKTLAGKLRPVAQRYRDVTPLQVLVIRKYIAAGMMEDALELARKAMLNDTTSAEPALLASMCMARLGKWDEALVTAQKWRQLTAGNSMSPDMLISAALLSTNRASEAIETLEKYALAANLGDPSSRSLLVLLVSAEIQDAQSEANEEKRMTKFRKATDTFWDAVQKNPGLREDWANCAVNMILRINRSTGRFDNVSVAREWLSRLTDVTKPDDVEGQMIVGLAWYGFGAKVGAGDAKEKAHTIIQSVVALPTAEKLLKARATMALAQLCELDGVNDRAIALYRESLTYDPKQFLAQNNLAMLLARTGKKPEDLVEAETLANAVISAQPKYATFYDTLAYVQRAARKYEDALKTIGRAVELDSTNPEWRVSQAEILIDAEKTDQAREALTKLETARISMAPMDQNVKARYDDARKKAGMK